jgi:hypothetical protein
LADFVDDAVGALSDLLELVVAVHADVLDGVRSVGQEMGDSTHRETGRSGGNAHSMDTERRRKEKAEECTAQEDGMWGNREERRGETALIDGDERRGAEHGRGSRGRAAEVDGATDATKGCQ